MRPSDEHQAKPTEPHVRPNLMSSARRGGNEDSILAKLEREPARRAQAGAGAIARLAWYGGAVLLALGLTGTLAWLASAQADGPPPLALSHAGLAPMATAPAAAPTTAVIVDAPPAVTTAEVMTPPLAPPLRLLERASTRPAPAPAAAPRPLARPTARAVGRPTAPRQGARTAKTAAPPRTVEMHDSDVALISAVIHHANGQAVPEPGSAPEACADHTCRTRPAR